MGGVRPEITCAGGPCNLTAPRVTGNEMKKAILSLCVAVTAAFAFIGCNKSSDGISSGGGSSGGGSSGGGEKSRVGGVNISDLDGHKFEKKEMPEMPAGKTKYKAETKPWFGYVGSVSVETEEIKEKLPTMDEYLEKAMKDWSRGGEQLQVQNKTDSTATVSGKNAFGTVIRRVFRDEAKNCFVVVRGWYHDRNDSHKAAVESCVNSAEL